MSKILQNYRISIEQEPDPKDLEIISKNLSADAESQGDYPKNHHKLVILVRDKENAVIGGLIADIAWGWLYILKI